MEGWWGATRTRGRREREGCGVPKGGAGFEETETRLGTMLSVGAEWERSTQTGGLRSPAGGRREEAALPHSRGLDETTPHLSSDATVAPWCLIEPTTACLRMRPRANNDREAMLA